jgi:hypothetical protein
MPAEQPKGQLCSKHEQRDNRNKHLQTEKSQGNLCLLSNSHKVDAVMTTVMRLEGIIYIYIYRVKTP